MFDAGATLDDQLQRPKAAPPAADSGPSFWSGFGTAAPRGIGSGVASAIAFGSEVAGAFGDVMGAYPEAMSYSLSDQQKQQGEAARRKLLAQGPSYSNEVGDAFRQRAHEIMPDPATTGTAGQVTAGLFEFTTKAVGYGMTLGPMGPLALGGDVGLSESDRLKQQGVDLATRTKAGAVAGVVAGGSVVVPMTGASGLIRGAKGVAVGEGSLMGQSLAEKAILKAAGYDKIADTFDPLDTVSLAVGLVPGALGAKFGHAAPKPGAATATPLTDMTLGQRQALKYNDVQLDAYAVHAAQREGIPPEVLLAVKNAGEKSNSTQTSTAGAKGVMQFMPETFKQFGRGDMTDPMNSIDAGAAYLKKLHDTYGDWDAAIAHYNSGGVARNAEGALVRAHGAPLPTETVNYLARVKGYLGKTLDEHVAAAVKDNPDLVPAARVMQASDALEASRLTDPADLAARDDHIRAVETAADQIARGDRVDVTDIMGKHAIDSARVADHVDQLAQLERENAAQSRTGRPSEGPADGAREVVHATVAGGDAPQGWAGATRIQREGAPISVYRGASRFLSPEDFSPESLGVASGHPSSGLGVFFTESKGEAAKYGDVEDAHLHLENPKVVKIEDLPGFDTVKEAHAWREKQRAAGHDGLVVTAKHLGGQTHYVAFEPKHVVYPSLDAPFSKAAAHEAIPTGEATEIAHEPAVKAEGGAEPIAQASIDRAAAEVAMLHPDMLVQLDGMDKPVRVADLLEQVKKEAALDASESKLVEAAVNCALRH